MKDIPMPLMQLMNSLLQPSTTSVTRNTVYGHNGQRISVYSKSVRLLGNALYFLGRDKSGKHFYVVTLDGNGQSDGGLIGVPMPKSVFGSSLSAKQCPMNHENAVRLRETFPFTRPVLIGTADSFGFGDRLGIANPAHLRALEGSHMRPVLAQQSIRELDRTQRTAGEVLDAASWAAFQEGYTAGFGADADHLKTTDDIDRYALAGFTMFTFDPSAYVINEAATLPSLNLRRRALQTETGDLRLEDALERYAKQTFRFEAGMSFQPQTEDITRAFLKYGKVMAHTVVLYRHLKQQHASLDSEVELSVDETDIPTTPAEHLFIAGELKRLGVKLVSLAPRFIGDFEKGVDYRGDLQLFEAEYRQHADIAKMMGPYKISIHSGSDKFSVYRTIGSLHLGNVHVKTAGTSYLEALRTVAMAAPDLIREILAFACEHYDTARQSYFVSARLDRLPRPGECNDRQLQDLFNQHDARQVFHVTFGQILSAKDTHGRFLFRDRLMKCLDENEEMHYQNLICHFRKHLDPFRLG